jgi:hypothetical protein
LEVPMKEVFLETYEMPEASNLQSVDSYILTSDGLWMFQITRSFDHDERSEGILRLLKYLKLVDKVKAEPSFAHLVFIVPLAMSNRFRLQKITRDPIFVGKTQEQVLDSDWIGIDKKRKLNNGGMTKVRHVLDAYDTVSQEIQLLKVLSEHSRRICLRFQTQRK